MATSDIIQLTLLIITTLGTISSIFIAIFTLRQNSKMIEETTRPNIIFYKDTLDINGPIEYLVIKNIGGSMAHITSIAFDKKQFEKLNSDYSKLTKALEYLNNSYIAPNQFYKIPIKTKDIKFDTLLLTISYNNRVKKYNESFTINLKQDYGINFTKQHSNNELKVISNAIQELIKRIS